MMAILRRDIKNTLWEQRGAVPRFGRARSEFPTAAQQNCRYLHNEIRATSRTISAAAMRAWCRTHRCRTIGFWNQIGRTSCREGGWHEVLIQVAAVLLNKKQHAKNRH